MRFVQDQLEGSAESDVWLVVNYDAWRALPARSPVRMASSKVSQGGPDRDCWLNGFDHYRSEIDGDARRWWADPSPPPDQ
jgi:hypothetical protein